MREHMGLFRGKHPNGMWVYGSLAVFRNIKNEPYTAIIPVEDGENQIRKLTRVDPDTVGECTGLRDKNGKLIFEGDLFRFDDECIGVVIFKGGCFQMQEHGMCETWTEGGYSEDSGGWGIVDCAPIDQYYVGYFEIIGNAHDNPELLKGAEDHAAD